LYLENLSGHGRDDEFFRDGITEDITTELAKIRRLRVLPRAAVVPLRDQPKTPAEAGRLLGATHILSGSVRRSGERLRVTVQMVEASGGHVTWTERYDRDLKDVFAVQDEIARSVAQALRISLTPPEEANIALAPTRDLEAYDDFLRGRNHARRQNRELALEMFERALQRDPNFALAHAGIANMCAMHYYLKQHDARWLERATAAVERAFALQPMLPEGYAALARIRYAQQRYPEAVAAAQKAIAIKEDCESSWDLLGRALFASDRWQEAASLVDRAIAAIGEDYNVYVPYLNVLRALGQDARADHVNAQWATVLERQIQWAPEDTRARVLLAGNFATRGRSQDAERELEKGLSIGTSDPHTIYNAACVYALIGKKSEAIETLRRASEAGYAEWDAAARDPDLVSLHDEPDFRRWLTEGQRGV
jgi:non-specific serine/threonine protein kinase